VNVAELAITSLIAVIGLYLAHSFTRQQRLKIAEQRVGAYRKLWGQMLVARPSRTEPPENKEPLTPAEAGDLYGKMTHWYFEGGNGMLLPHDTREMYLEAKGRLGRYAMERREPGSGKAGRQVTRHLSLLRSQMKNDLDIYGVFYFDALDPEDREFIRASGLDPERWGRRWHQWAASPRYWIGRFRNRGHKGSEWQTQDLGADADHIAPDGTEIRELVAFPSGDLWHATLPVGSVSLPVRHKNVNELWYVLDGAGELWRRREGSEEVVELLPARAVSIPAGVSFQFRTTGGTPLQSLGVTMPRFPGAEEAEAVDGCWTAPVSASS
jgi:mannose-6-phosphate isomerase-like protein (cupin superfamily)